MDISNFQGNTTLSATGLQDIFIDIEEQEKLFEDVGVLIDIKSDKIPVLKQEQALVVKDMVKYFDCENAVERLSSFIRSLKMICKKEKYCKTFLLPTVLKNNDDSTSNIYQDSLFRIFLKVPCLQHEIAMKILLDALTVAAMDEIQDTSWLRNLLKPLRYLPDIKNSDVLTNKLLDILQISTFTCQLEILDAIPQIIPDNDCAIAAKKLIALLDDNDELSGAIIDCLNALNLECEVRAQIQDRILAKLLAGTSTKIFPVLVQFLLSDSKSINLVSTLFKVKNALENIMVSKENNEQIESNKILIFHSLQMLTMSQKTIFEGWLTTISSIKSPNDHKPIDLLIMFMLHYTSEVRKRVIEGIFRKRVNAGLFKKELLEKVFGKYLSQQLLKDYMHSIIEIGCCLLRSSKDSTVAEFATSLFELLFTHRHTGTVYRGEIISSLISLTAYTDQIVINTVLKLLFLLATTNRRKMQIHVVLLMQLLEKLDVLELRDVKIVFDILCFLTCDESNQDALSGFKNEIHIFVRKLLSNSERVTKHRGIVSALVMVKHMASVDSELDRSSSIDESLSISDFPEPNAKEAAFLIELTNNCTGNCPELLGLYYDQLASVLASSYYFDKYFLYWLYDTATNYFKELFLSDIVPDPLNDLTFTMQYAIRETEDISSFAIDIAGDTVWKKGNKILLLAPFFRVVRLLHSRQHNENISTLDDLLTCGVILPNVDDPESLDFEATKQVVDCLFHCANWFREIISAFVSQKDLSTQRKVVQRLRDLIDVEKKIFLFLNYVPGHHLPVSYFDSLMNISKKMPKSEPHCSKNPPKKIKSVSIINETIDASINTQRTNKPKKGNKLSKITRPKVQFREIDTDIVRLMKYPLNLEDYVETDSSQAICLNLEEVKFLLKDLVNKISVLTENKDSSLIHLNDVVLEHLIKDSVFLFPHIDEYFNTIVKRIRELLMHTDERQDLPDWLTDEAVNLRCCFGYILHIFYLVFKWPGFKLASNIDSLRNLLKSLRLGNSQTGSSVSKLITAFVVRLGLYTNECTYLRHAVDLIRTMEVLYHIVMPNEELKKKMAKTAEMLLNKRWYNDNGQLDRGKECNENINILIRISLLTFNVKKTYGLVETIRKQVDDLKLKEDCLTSIIAINKQNFHVFYLGLCNILLESVKTEVQSLTNKQHLELWTNVALTMQSLKEIAKSSENRTNLVCFLKKSVAILKVFLSHGVPILEIMLKSKPIEVSGIFRTLQESTRYLHSLCCESKVNKDARVVTYIPTFRHILESLVYRVKAALVANNLSEVFVLGSLKNKRLDGKELTQESESSSTGEGDESQECLPSDNEDVSFILDETISDQEAQDSEVYN